MSGAALCQPAGDRVRAAGRSLLLIPSGCLGLRETSVGHACQRREALRPFPCRREQLAPRCSEPAACRNATPLRALSPLAFVLHVPTQTASYIMTFLGEVQLKEGERTHVGMGARILRQCVEGTAVMKVSVATTSGGCTHHPHCVATLRPCGKASLSGTATSSLLCCQGCCPPTVRPQQCFGFSALVPAVDLHAAADWSMLHHTGAAALWPC